MTRPIKAISFDAADTLIYLPTGVGGPYAEIARRHGLDASPAEWESAFRAAWKRAPAPEVTADGGPAPDDRRGWWQALVTNVVADFDPHWPEVFAEEIFPELYEHFARPGVWALYPEVLEVLGALRDTGIPLAVISNFDKRLFATLADSGIAEFFDDVFLSSEHGADKPHPRMFERFLARHGLTGTPDLALHVGDHPKADWAAAQAVGMQFLELDRAKGGTLRDVLSYQMAPRVE